MYKVPQLRIGAPDCIKCSRWLADQRLGGAEVIGPMLVGMGKPVHVVQQGDAVTDIVNLAGVAVGDAQREW